MNVSSSVLALLVALVTVITAAAPVIVPLMRGSYSDLSLTFQRGAGDTVLFIASNSGTKPSTITRADLHVSYEAPAGNGYDAISGGSTIDLVSENENWLIGAGETKQIAFRLSPREAERIRAAFPGSDGPPTLASRAPPEADVSAKVIVQIVEFGGHARVVETPVNVGCFPACGFR